MASDIIARGIAAKAAADLKKTAADLEDFKEDTAEALAGKADLVDGKVPSEQLPSYVDDVTEYADVESFPATGEFGKIYVALDTGYTYRWSGSEYIQIGGQDLSVITGNFAEVYDPTSTYEEGDFCIYEDAFYAANQDIDPAEAWDASHWDRTSVAAVFASLQAEDARLAAALGAHEADTNNPHSVTKAQVGLGNVDNTSDLDKPISTATQAALDEKVDEDDTTNLGIGDEQVEGAPLARSIIIGEDSYNIPAKTSDIENDSGYVNQVDDEISASSENPVQNKVIKAALDEKVDEDDTTNFTMDEDQVEGAPLLGSMTIDEDSYNIPRKTSELENDAHFVEEEDTTDLEFNTEIVEGAPLLRSISVGEDDYNLPSKTSDLTNDSGYVDTVDAALSDVSENPVQNKVVKAALDEKVDEGATSGMTISEQQVAGAPLMGSVTIEEDSFNVPTKTSDLQNDSGFITDAYHDATKQDVINDLNDIRSGAAAGATAVQPSDLEPISELSILRLFRTEYPITATVTNGTAIGDTSIWTDETANITITADFGYDLPASITVSGATYVYDDSTGVVSLSAVTGNVAIAGECAPHVTPTDMPAKGDIITLDGGSARYRVLGVSGNEALLLAMDNYYRKSVYNSSGATKIFDGGKTGQEYEGSTLDNLLNISYYNSLSYNVKSAIVDQTIIQRMYSYQNPDDPSYDYHQQYGFDASKMRGLQIEDQTTVGSRHVFALDVKDIFDYLGKDTMTSAELIEMFFEQTTPVTEYNYIWLSSAYSGNSWQAFVVLGHDGAVYYTSYSNENIVRPAFRIDLSQVTFTKE